MANDKKFVVKNGLTTSNVNFVDSVTNTSNAISVTMSDTGTLSFSGSSGQLFSITDSLSGTIFAVNDISGIPSIEVDDDGTIRLAEYDGNILIGTATDDGSNKLQVNGNIAVTGTVDGRDVAADGTKLDGIEAGAQVNVGTNLGTSANTTTRTVTSSTGTNVVLPSANSTQAGVMLSTDKTKLDGIEAGATGDMSASEILTAIKTVDGAASGLNADLLDGQHASAFASASHTHSYLPLSGGTVSGPITFGAGVELSESTDRADVLQIKSLTGGWGGLQITNNAGEGLWSFMTDGTVGGIYDDKNEEWAVSCVENGSVNLRHNGVAKLFTTSEGVDVTGNLTVTSSSYPKIEWRNTGNTVDPNDYWIAEHDANGNLQIRYRDDSAGSWGSNLMLSPNGNVGIGKSPSNRLDIYGGGNSLRFSGPASNSTGGMEFYNTVQQVATIGVGGADGHITLSSDPSNAVVNSGVTLEVDGAERLKINSTATYMTGNVEVSGDTSVSGKVSAQHVALSNLEMVNMSGDGTLWHDASEGIYHIATNSLYSSPALLFSRANFSTGNSLSVSYTGANKPTVSLDSNIAVDNISRSATDGNLQISGGTNDDGAKLTLYGSTAVYANQMRMRASEHQFYDETGTIFAKAIDQNLRWGQTSTNTPANGNVSGSALGSDGTGHFSKNGIALYVNRITTSGTLIQFKANGSNIGNITHDGSGNVSLTGGNIARWSRVPAGYPVTTKDLLLGTVMSNLDEMIDWKYVSVWCETAGHYHRVDYTGEEPSGAEVEVLHEGVTYTGVVEIEDNAKLNYTKVSDEVRDKDVAGVMLSIDVEDDYGDYILSMAGDVVIRIAAGVTVQRGDLLVSAGNGTAIPQEDDLVRSSTIAKVNSTFVYKTHPDGSYCVPVTLMVA